MVPAVEPIYKLYESPFCGVWESVALSHEMVAVVPVTDTSKPDGMPRKVLDVSRINKLGWKHSINIKEGLQKTYEWYLKGV